MAYDQSTRILKITTTLGPDEVRLTELDGIDELSKPFVFTIRMSTEKSPDEVKALLGTEATIEIGPEGFATSRKKLRGYFRRLTRILGEFGTDLETEWRAELVPRFWFMSQRSNIKIHFDVTLADILRKFFQEYGAASPNIKASKLASQRFDYCVQYRESDMDFLSRLMEKFGWFYFHEHTASATTMVIADTNMQGSAGPIAPVGPIGSWGTRSIWTLEDDFAIQPGKWCTADFDYKDHVTNTNTSPTKIPAMALPSQPERYDYPGGYFEKSRQPGDAGLAAGQGKDLTDIAMEREEARYNLRRGSSDLAELQAGSKLTIQGSDLPDGNVLVTWIRHRAQDYSHWTDSDWEGKEYVAPSYSNEFVCMPQRVPFRPAASTPRPVVQGPQTATVIDGADGEPDSLGRVRVKFHWDRDGGSGSCWLRVSQGWAGNGFGQMHLPRVGEEVIVDFLEGDPDRPIITGRVYNGKNKVPYDLPGKKTQYGIKTNSIGGSGFNELRFDDKSGSEEVYVHAQKAMLVEVKDTRTAKITTDDKLEVLNGNYTAKVNSGGVTIEAATEIVLKVGNNKITINTQGVKIEGMMVEAKGTASATVDSPKTTVGGAGMTSVTGSMIKIA